MFHGIKLTAPAEAALSKVQDTTLNPMEEALFQAWSHANGIEKPDDPNNLVDLRGLYQGMKGSILPNSQLKQIVEKANAQSKLQELLTDRYKSRVTQSAQQRLALQDQGAQHGADAPMPHPTNAMVTPEGVQ